MDASLLALAKSIYCIRLMKNGGYRLSMSDPTPDRVTLPVKINK